MEAFLVESKSALSDLSRYQQIKIVLGNCTCDLDSSVCSLAQGLFYYHELNDDDKKIVAVIPIMNISDKEFRVKTEVVWFLRENNIPSSLITFRNQIDLKALAEENRLQLTLVDHHVLPSEDFELLNYVDEIIDHRPQDPDWLWPNAKMTLDPVGSCATLVAKNIFTKNPKIMDEQLRNLLRGPILVDTSNFSAEAGRAKLLDFEIIRDLEDIETSTDFQRRNELYDKIMAAKTDISQLTAGDLLIKDLKVVGDVAIPGFPILVEKFIELPNALEDVLSFTRVNPFALAILLGMDLKGEKMRRDIGVFSPRIDGQHELATRVMESLTKCTNPPLGLKPLNAAAAAAGEQDEDSEVAEKGYVLHLFSQENVQATRKQILPIIQRALAEFRCQC